MDGIRIRKENKRIFWNTS